MHTRSPFWAYAPRRVDQNGPASDRAAVVAALDALYGPRTETPLGALGGTRTKRHLTCNRKAAQY
jgi:hypothetical protein